jgi:hypothetical protein
MIAVPLHPNLCRLGTDGGAIPCCSTSIRQATLRMTLQELGSIGELIGGLGVVFSLIYVGFQIRQNSSQIEQNSRHLEASMYHASGEGFNHWNSLFAQSEGVADIWQRGLEGVELTRTEQRRFNALASILFTTLENNYHQLQIGSHHRNTMEISQDSWKKILATPGGRAWWTREARRSFTPVFIDAVETLVSLDQPSNSGDADD